MSGGNLFERKRPKTRKGLKLLEKRLPAVVEGTKTALFIRGSSANQVVTDVMKDLSMLKKPNAIFLSQKRSNVTFPFADPSMIESFSYRYNASLFMFGCNTKKRPNNLIIGRLFDFRILDMFEFTVTNYVSIKEFMTYKSINAFGSKPVFVLFGEAFTTDEIYKTIANLFVDFFRGTIAKSIGHMALDHVIALSIENGVIQFTHHSLRLNFKDNESPETELKEIGPSIKMRLGRHQMASEDLRRQSLEVPKVLQSKKKKNQKRDEFNSKVAQIHVPSPQLNKIATKRSILSKRKPEACATDHSLKKTKTL